MQDLPVTEHGIFWKQSRGIPVPHAYMLNLKDMLNSEDTNMKIKGNFNGYTKAPFTFMRTLFVKKKQHFCSMHLLTSFIPSLGYIQNAVTLKVTKSRRWKEHILCKKQSSRVIK